jgi:hypothetical protein
MQLHPIRSDPGAAGAQRRQRNSAFVRLAASFLIRHRLAPKTEIEVLALFLK